MWRAEHTGGIKVMVAGQGEILAAGLLWRKGVHRVCHRRSGAILSSQNHPAVL